MDNRDCVRLIVRLICRTTGADCIISGVWSTASASARFSPSASSVAVRREGDGDASASGSLVSIPAASCASCAACAARAWAWTTDWTRAVSEYERVQTVIYIVSVATARATPTHGQRKAHETTSDNPAYLRISKCPRQPLHCVAHDHWPFPPRCKRARANRKNRSAHPERIRKRCEHLRLDRIGQPLDLLVPCRAGRRLELCPIPWDLREARVEAGVEDRLEHCDAWE